MEVQIRRGRTRIVLLLPFFGVAVKFARIKLVDVLNILWKNRKDLQFIRRFVTDAPSNWYTLRWHLFQGILDNLSEARFYSTTKNMFAWPTLFSCGLFSVQKLGMPCGLKDGELYKKLLSVAGNDIAEDGHCFSNPRNFCVDGNGKLYLLDYASPVSQQVLRKYEEELRRKL